MPSASKIVLLGTGTPIADPERSGPSVAIIVNDTPYIVDCGPGVVRRAAAAQQGGTRGIAVTQLRRVFLTHLHSDHTSGLADLILAPWVLGRKEPLEVYGPAGTRAMTKHLLAAYDRDIRERLDGAEPANDEGWRVTPREIKAGTVYRDANITVEAFPVRHGSWPAFGYRFTTPDRIIVISGDTAPTEAIISAGFACDVLIHEAYALAGFAAQATAWKKYHSSMHTSSHELAGIARRVRPKLLILYHQLFWGTTEGDLLAEVRERYDGPVVSGTDLGVY